MGKAWEGWRFLSGDGELSGDGSLPDACRVKAKASVKDAPVLCKWGTCTLCALWRATAALADTQRLIACRLRFDGAITADGDNEYILEPTVAWTADATRVLHEFAVWCAELALRVGNVRDKHCWGALDVKRRWLDGRVTDEELVAAMDMLDVDLASARAVDSSPARGSVNAAAWNAVRTALSRSALYAAWGTAWDATWAVASTAVGSVSMIASCGGPGDDLWQATLTAAWAAVTDRLDMELERRLMALHAEVTPSSKSMRPARCASCAQRPKRSDCS